MCITFFLFKNEAISPPFSHGWNNGGRNKLGMSGVSELEAKDVLGFFKYLTCIFLKSIKVK